MQKSKIDIEEMLDFVREKGFEIYGCQIDSSKLVFEERVTMNCFYCEKYGNNWRCPPKIPSIDYKKMMEEFDNIMFIYIKMSLENENYAQVRNESSIKLHRALLECEQWLYNHNNSTSLSFIGGSCKLCKNGCAQDRCANPYYSRTPVEALGINVVKSAELCGIEIKFPPTEYMMRIGLLLW